MVKTGKISIKRLDLWLACLDPTLGSEIQKTRPVLVVSRNENNRGNSVITILPITSNIHFIADFDVFIPEGTAGLSKDSKAKADQIRTIAKERLIKKIGRLPESYQNAVNNSLLIHLDLKIH
jgi:mRNA interferase MazF